MDASIRDYAALVAGAFGLQPEADALEELERRLQPDDPAERPPPRAPAVLRLSAALEALRAGSTPDESPQQFADDLQVLKLFSRDDDWSEDALRRLLDDVIPARAPRRRAPRLKPVPPPDESG